MIAAAPVVIALDVVEAAPAVQDAPSVADLVQTINSNLTALKREDAAVQLVGRNTPDAMDQIDALLKNSDYPQGQIAVAKALAKSSNPNPGFITDLVHLLGQNPDITEQASLALAGMDFDQHGNAFDSLRNFAIDAHNADNVRVKAITAMGLIVQKPVAESLVNLLGAPNQNTAITNAAADALSELTGIASYGHDVKQWQQWWNGIKNKSAVEFRSRVLDTRDQQEKQLRQHEAQLVKAMGDHLNQNYLALRGVDPRAAEQTLLGYLNDPTPEVRFIGAKIAGLFSQAAGAPVRDKLLKMVGDPDDSIRLEVITVLLTVNDPRAIDGLVGQLKAEKNLEIRILIIDEFGKLQDPKAVPALLELLHDPQPEIVIASANAISDLGPKLRQNNPDTADQASGELRKMVDPGAAVRPRDDILAACVKALGALRDKQSFDLFSHLVQPGEPSQVRQAALLGFQDLADTRADTFVLEQVGDNDRDVRAAAAAALETTATPAQADAIFQHMKSDTYKPVSDALWVALQHLYPQLRTTDLARIADDLAFDPDKQLVTLQKLGEKYAAENDALDVARNQQVIATAMVAVKPPKYLEAIDNLTKALAYWHGPGHGDSDKLEGIIGELLDDQLKAGQWDEATKFAAEQIKSNPSYQLTVGPRIKDKAEELSNTNPTAATTLINDALKMDPPLKDNYISEIHLIQEKLKQKASAPPG